MKIAIAILSLAAALLVGACTNSTSSSQPTTTSPGVSSQAPSSPSASPS